jgi:hypothetical protein
MGLNAILSDHPTRPDDGAELLERCAQACFDCAQACAACADACLGEAMVDLLRRCIRLNQDCADVCFATGCVASRFTEMGVTALPDLLAACVTACDLCADECERHAGQHPHCLACARRCRTCAQACRDVYPSAADATRIRGGE